MYRAVGSGDVDVISAFSSDGRIAQFGLKLLSDPKGALPPYDAVLLVTDHTELPYQMIHGAARLIVDSRNAFRRHGLDGDHIVLA